MTEKRLYGLFEKQGDRWVRLYPSLAFKKSKAVEVFQDALLAPMWGIDGERVKGIRELRPLPPKP